jgi:hypothetical protein
MAKEHDGGETGSEEATDEAELPASVVEEAERLTRRARDAVDPNEAAAYRDRRDELLADYEFTARVREDDDAVLVVHPAEWVEDGTVRPERIEDIDRGIERPLEGTADPDDWEGVAERNRELAAAVEAEHGEVHGANARALAEFMSNHYAKPVADATDEELAVFVEEYYPRNVWPTDDQKAVVEESVRLVRDRALTERQ